MGDVALAAPVIRAMTATYPDVEIIILTRQPFTAFFPVDPKVKLFIPDFSGRHKGAAGLLMLYRDIIRSGTIDHVIDLHDVIRTIILRAIFRLSGIPVSVIQKGRREKLGIIKGRRKIALKHTVERYNDVFKNAGFNLEPEKGPSILPDHETFKKASEIYDGFSGLRIGVSPYARHHLKLWPEEYLKKLLGLISEKHEVRFFFFGGRDEEKRIERLAGDVPGSVNLCARLPLREEIAVIAGLDLMIAMDSANMHLAALTGIKTVSIWGGTDPLTGFGAWMQPDNYAIRIPVDELTCRPCTVYGKGKCKRGDFACMMWMTPETVFRRITESGVLNK